MLAALIGFNFSSCLEIQSETASWLFLAPAVGMFRCAVLIFFSTIWKFEAWSISASWGRKIRKKGFVAYCTHVHKAPCDTRHGAKVAVTCDSTSFARSARKITIYSSIMLNLTKKCVTDFRRKLHMPGCDAWQISKSAQQRVCDVWPCSIYMYPFEVAVFLNLFSQHKFKYLSIAL
jgi:hypothetical protein